MRLHTLHLNAVGPFADQQIVDFDRLAAGGLFLFDGPTGVGKSTILDALTFALYGGLASESGDPARMRSDFADPGARPEVTLEFSVRGGRHRITRSPEYTRPKKRGQGVTREKSSVHLQRLVAGTWESRSHAKDEVGAIIGELLGLSREQFRQVVLLPQGEFATFLRADDDQRREVLGRLFGTQFFRRVTEGLQARAQDASRALQAADSELQSRVAAATEAAGLGPDEHVELSEPLEVLETQCRRHGDALMPLVAALRPERKEIHDHHLQLHEPQSPRGDHSGGGQPVAAEAPVTVERQRSAGRREGQQQGQVAQDDVARVEDQGVPALHRDQQDECSQQPDRRLPAHDDRE
jgi:DNA repair exonuclease SbcCD ATPase subunit